MYNKTRIIYLISDIRKELSICNLSQVYFVVMGVAMGAFYGRYTKSYRPLFAAIFLGTIADSMYAKMYGCKDLQDEFSAFSALSKRK